MLTGMIVKGIGGFYYVETDSGVISCRARGLFRKEGISPCPGDIVDISMTSDGEGYVEMIHPRKNHLARPPVSNIDKLFIVSSVADPEPNTVIIDKMIAVAELKDIEPILIITKADVESSDTLTDIYSSVGIRTVVVSSVTGEGIESIREILEDGISVFSGNSGVGKSTLLNSLFPELDLKTGITSKKLGRGKHTTRHVELYKISDKMYLADTPGFSTMDIERYEMIDKDQLVYGFREFQPYLGKCRFNSCTHTCETGCKIIEAVENKIICQSRFDSYIHIYNEVKDIKQWQTQKNV